MNNNNAILSRVFLLFALLITHGAFAADSEPDGHGLAGYTDRGADSCLRCHDEFSDFPVLSIFKTKHGEPDDPHSPFARLQCESCHGPGDAHADVTLKESDVRPPIRAFGPGAPTPVEEQNKTCLGCHQGRQHIAWQGSTHELENVSCASCHTVHREKDPMRVRAEQAQVCFDCHGEQRADVHKTSSHPIRFGQMACSECHDPHGSFTPTLLRGQTLNQTCYQCHADKRGPFLWEHAPVAEDCSLCHEPHGSIHPALLRKRPPLLCQECHAQDGHPSVAYTGNALPEGNPSAYVLGSSCLNCHSRVHGSNHPSGVKLMR